jgi:ABC-type transporter Mla subunit MlaD
MPKLMLALLTLAATALIAAGCGGDDGGDGGGELSKEDYAGEVRDVLEPLGTELQEIGDVVRESSDAEELADNVRTAEDEIQGAVDDLESIEPPSEAQGAHDLLVGALNRFNDALKALSDAADSEEVERIVSTAQELPPAVGELRDELEEVREALGNAGIDVGG